VQIGPERGVRVRGGFLGDMQEGGEARFLPMLSTAGLKARRKY
jgi:hypothetical protein